jgi:glucose-6-phosphate 1-dehydrogenase
MIGEPTELTFVHHTGADEIGPYERLLGDAMNGDPTLFAREDAVEQAWRIVQPILGDCGQVFTYVPGTWGPSDADRLTRDVGGWYHPGSSAER